MERPQGRFESPFNRGPGMRYRLELADDRFTLQSFAWALTGREDRATGEPDASLIGVRTLSGRFRAEGVHLVLHALSLMDQAGDGGAEPLKRDVSEFITVTVIGGPSDEMQFKLYGSEVTVLRARG